MMKRTDRHFLHLLRMLSRRAMFYTEMIPARAALSGDKAHRGFEEFQRPLGLQLGGSDPAEMARCARIGEDLGYDEININVGCPSVRATKGSFGACLMQSPERVADCVAAMSARAAVPVTIKCRIGTESDGGPERESDAESFDRLCRFVDEVSGSGCETFIVHARKAVLNGMSPEKNRKIPPLKHDLVRLLKLEFPRLEIILNGGIKTLSQAKAGLCDFDGVMLGRAVYRQPMLLAQVDRMFYGDRRPPVSHEDAVAGCLEYLAREARHGTPAASVTRHLMNWFRGHRNAGHWRRYVSDDVLRRDWRTDIADLSEGPVPGTAGTAGDQGTANPAANP